MTLRRHWSSASALCSIFLLLPSGLCHMEMSWPYPLRSKFNPANSYDSIDYSMTSPLEKDGSNYPCKGYQKDQAIQPVITYTAGSTYNMTLSGSATHSGGSCQISLSYDNGANFRVIKSMIGGCPLQSTYDFTIPSYMPAGDALLAWTWQNKVGNREFYMNCAEVSIEAGSLGRKTRREAATSFDALPYVWRANLAAFGDCGTSEGSDAVYPNPGPDVEYGDDATSDSPASPGECDGPVGRVKQVEVLSDSETAASFLSGSSASVDAPTVPTEWSEPYAKPSIDVTSEDMSSVVDNDRGGGYTGPELNAQARAVDSTSQASSTAASLQAYSTSTVYVDCPDTITLTIYPSPSTTTTVTAMPSYYTTSAACTGTSASCPCAQGFACDQIGPCRWACNAQSTPPATFSRSSWTRSWSTTWTTRTTRPSSRPTSPYPNSRTSTATPVKPSPNPPSQPTNRPPYATGDPNRYLPCVPGTFICTSATTWDTCNWNDDGSEWIYGYGRDLSEGMMCLTNLSPYSRETNEYAQQALTPAGYYRDDRIVRERPDGDCDIDGSVLCTDGGQQFDVCDHGGWVRMGRVAEGTRCENGRIVASS